MVIPKQTDFEMCKIYSVHSVRSNDSVVALIAASNGGLHLVACFCRPNKPEFDDYLSHKNVSENLIKKRMNILCATDITRLGLATIFPVRIETHTCTLTFTIKAVPSELLCISNSTSMASSTERARRGKFCM